MNLEGRRHSALTRALAATELRLRNRSLPGDWCFAIYEDHGEGYLGLVKLVGDVLSPTGKNCRREEQILSGLCREFARQLGGAA